MRRDMEAACERCSTPDLQELLNAFPAASLHHVATAYVEADSDIIAAAQYLRWNLGEEEVRKSSGVVRNNGEWRQLSAEPPVVRPIALLLEKYGASVFGPDDLLLEKYGHREFGNELKTVPRAGSHLLEGLTEYRGAMQILPE